MINWLLKVIVIIATTAQQEYYIIKSKKIEKVKKSVFFKFLSQKHGIFEDFSQKTAFF